MPRFSAHHSWLSVAQACAAAHICLPELKTPMIASATSIDWNDVSIRRAR